MPASFPTARLTLGQMRRSVGRLTSAGVAIMISTAFVAVTLLSGKVVTEVSYNVVAAGYGQSDVVVALPEGSTSTLDDATVARIAGLDGVAAAQTVDSTFAELRAGGRAGERGGFQVFTPVPVHPRLSPLTVTDGDWPATATEVALTAPFAERLDVGIGDTVTVRRSVYPEGWAAAFEQGGQEAADAVGEPEQVTEELTVTGLTEDRYGAFGGYGGAAAITPETLTAWNADDAWPSVPDELVVALDSPLEGAALPAGLSAAVDEVLPDAQVATREARAKQEAANQMGGQDLVYLVFGLTFAAIALLVAAMVISNTFQVLVAQRVRTLALLRCIGAGAGQLYRSVLLEAAVLGAVASVAGIALGGVLGQAALSLAPAFDLGVPLPGTIAPTWQAIVLPVCVGVGVTVLAALAPARAATRVAPLAALRPSDAPTLRARSGRIRLLFAVLCTVVGFAGVGLGVWLGLQGGPQYGLIATVLGGALSFFGIVLGSVLWLPRVAAWLGALVARTGPAPRLAVANTLRNPRRTAATSTALLVGVTLVTMMSTGAASARSTADGLLADEFPYDLGVTPADGGLVADVHRVTADVDGVAETVVVTSVPVSIGEADDLTVASADPAELAAVVHVSDEARRLADGTILLTDEAADTLSAGAGDTVTVTGEAGSVDLEVVLTSATSLNRWIAPADLARVAGDTAQAEVWASLEPGADPTTVLSEVQGAVGEVDGAALVMAPAAQADQFRQVVDVILGVVVGLLAVAVVIALVGVTNTLSLSVLERTRESATLRAIGLSTGQLRGMLAVEGMLIAGVGAVLGIVLGLVYGWAGSATALALMGDVRYAVPWTDVLVVLAVALVAGLLASVVPARAAARTSPVAALGAE